MLETISSNVRALGEVLGQTIAEDKGNVWVDNIEEVRLLGKRVVAGDTPSIDKLQSIFAHCSEQDLLVHARAFSQFLNLANVAEQQHTTSEKGLAELDLPHPLDSLAEKLDCVDATQFKEALSKLHIELVLTAHPTEVNRRTFIHKYNEVADELGKGESALSSRTKEIIE